MKYRLWDKKKKEFIKDTFYIDPEGILLDSQLKPMKLKRFIVQESIGCKCTKGLPIFEGDIIRHYNCGGVASEGLHVHGDVGYVFRDDDYPEYRYESFFYDETGYIELLDNEYTVVGHIFDDQYKDHEDNSKFWAEKYDMLDDNMGMF